MNTNKQTIERELGKEIEHAKPKIEEASIAERPLTGNTQWKALYREISKYAQELQQK